MEAEKILLHEMDTLRQELRHLKDCQVRYFLLSITTTVAILGFGNRIDRVSSLIPLAPLIVIIPCWWTFFDKASSITRIVGYYRVLEQMIILEGTHHYYGWERSLGLFRDMQIRGELQAEEKGMVTILREEYLLLSARTAHKYWVFNWYTFFALAVLCMILSTLSDANVFPFAFSLIAVILSAAANLKTLADLVFGRLSYDSNETFWNKILSIAKTEP